MLFSPECLVVPLLEKEIKKKKKKAKYRLCLCVYILYTHINTHTYWKFTVLSTTTWLHPINKVVWGYDSVSEEFRGLNTLIFLAYTDVCSLNNNNKKMSFWITEEAVSFLIIVVLKVWSPQTVDGLLGVSGWSASWFLLRFIIGQCL